MNPIIRQQDISIQKEIYYTHLMDIGKNYLKHKKVGKAVLCAFNSKRPLNMLGDYMKGFVRYLKK